MSMLSLTGLDAQNPLGYFAALGLLRVVDAHMRLHKREAPRLSFDPGTQLTAAIHCQLDYPALCELVLRDAQEQASSAALGLAYDGRGERCDRAAPDAERDLKPSPHAAAEYLAALAGGPRRDADLAAGLLSDIAQDNNNRTKPSAFHFTAGQQSFLQMVEALRTDITQAALDEALLGPWRNVSKLPSLGWDSSVTRLYALRASDPSKEKRGSVPGANWLAVHALAFFPVTGRHGRALTTAVSGGWKSSKLVWPVWDVPLTARVVASLLKCDCLSLRDLERRAWGITEIFQSSILRSDQGGYGSFTPAAVATRK